MNPVLLAVGVFVVVAGIAAVLAVVFSGSRKTSERAMQLASQAPARETAERKPERPYTGVADRLPALTGFLQTTPWWEELQLELLRAGILLKPSELIGMMAGGALLGVAGAYLALHSLGTAALLGMLCGAAPWMWVKMKQAKRMRDLVHQLPDAIDMMSTALRTGFSFLRAVQLIGSQMQAPIADEFRRLAAEVQMGMATDDALNNLVERTHCYDLELLVAAVQIHLTVGGNLSEILDNIAGTIRERVKLQGEISAATAEGRMSAGILIVMPFAMAIIINIANPGYMRPLFTTPIGIGLTLVAGVLMGVGAMIIRKMVEIDI